MKKFRDIFGLYILFEFPIQLTDFCAAHPVIVEDHAVVFVIALNGTGKFIWQWGCRAQQKIVPLDMLPNVGLVISMYAQFAQNVELANARLFAQFTPKSIQ